MFACVTIPLNFIKKLSLEKTVPFSNNLTLYATLLIPWCPKLTCTRLDSSLIFSIKARVHQRVIFVGTLE